MCCCVFRCTANINIRRVRFSSLFPCAVASHHTARIMIRSVRRSMYTLRVLWCFSAHSEHYYSTCAVHCTFSVRCGFVPRSAYYHSPCSTRHTHIPCAVVLFSTQQALLFDLCGSVHTLRAPLCSRHTARIIIRLDMRSIDTLRALL